MKKEVVHLLLISVIYFGIGFGGLAVVNAEEIGQVQTNAGVGFYEASTDSSTIEATTTTTKPTNVTKPKGRYPSTGELVKKSIAISGIVLILFVVIFILWKRKKNQQTKKGKEGGSC